MHHRAALGVNQWFHYEDFESLERCRNYMRELGVRHLRTGVSWADYHRPAGREWYDHQMEMLSEFEILLSAWHTPPSISKNGAYSGPPQRLEDFADFIGELSERYGEQVEYFELWNEPNNRLNWDFIHSDPGWQQFASMIAAAARAAKHCGQQTVLGGIIPVDPQWLRLMLERGALEDIDVLAIHGFPEMWWSKFPSWERYRDWHGWEQKVQTLHQVLPELPVWITETGLATVELETRRPARHELQCEMLQQAAAAPVPRVYWYSLMDLDPSGDAIEGFHVDENEYHMGLVSFEGRRKPAFHMFQALLQPGLTARAELETISSFR